MGRRPDKSLLGALGQIGGRGTQENSAQRQLEPDVAGSLPRGSGARQSWTLGGSQDSPWMPGSTVDSLSKRRRTGDFKKMTVSPPLDRSLLEHRGACDQQAVRNAGPDFRREIQARNEGLLKGSA